MKACVLVGAAFVLAGSTPVAASPEVTSWAPRGISSAQFESHPAFDPRTGDLYFVRSTPSFEGWRIYVSHCGEQGWSEPAPPAFAGDGVEADPWFTPDGSRLYFISTRSTDGVKRADLDIWLVDRDASGRWGVPVRLPEPVNSPGAEWFPRPGVDGWLYFGSDRPGGLGKTDIWRARQQADGRWVVENAGAAINTAGDEFEPLPAPDGSRMIVMADGGLYQTRLGPKGWLPRVKLPPQVDVNGSEIGALFSPSGKTLLFARDTGAPLSGEFFVWHPDGEEAWPPACPATGAGTDAPGGDAALQRLLERQTQELANAVTAGDRAVWDRYLDPAVAYTAEDGAVKSKTQLLDEIGPLPPGISGTLSAGARSVSHSQGGSDGVVPCRQSPMWA